METSIIKRHKTILSDKLNQTIVDVIGYLFMLLFVYAAANKLISYDKFLVELNLSPMLTEYSKLISWQIPLIEILISIMLFIPRTALLGLYASLSLMVMFTTYIIIIMNYSEHIPCSCGGILDSMGWKEHLIFNIVFVLFAFIGIVLQTNLNKNNTSK